MPAPPPPIIFVNRFFYPDHSATSEILSDLAFALARRGFAIAVITSRLHYDDPKNVLPVHEIIDDVDIWRVWTSRYGRDQPLTRLFDYMSFYVTAAWRLWRLARSDDVIVAKTDPPLLSVMAAGIAWLCGAKLVTWQQDVFPEVAEAIALGGVLARFGFMLLRLPRDWSLRRACCNVVVGARMADRLRQAGVATKTIRVIPNWADGTRIAPIEASDNCLRRDWGLSRHFVVGYAGNLGRAHEIETILGAMKALSQTTAPHGETTKPIKFLFVGGGALRAKLEAEADRLALTNLELRSYQPRDQVSAVLSTADVHLVMLNPKLEGLVMPSKIYAIAAAGRPVIFIGARDGEIACLVRDEGFGFSVSPSNVGELEQRILQLARSPHLCRIMGERARAAFEQSWDKPIAIAQWHRLLAEISCPRH